MLSQVKSFIADIKKIIQEITWPERKILIQLTIVVIFISFVTAFTLGGADFLFTKLLGLIT